MKTEEQWFKEQHEYSSFGWLRAIRLDAYKAGMVAAAESAAKYAKDMRGAHVNANDSAAVIKRLILTAAEQLKELPK